MPQVFFTLYLVVLLSLWPLAKTNSFPFPETNPISSLLSNTGLSPIELLGNPLVQALLNSSTNQMSNLIQYSGTGMGELGDYPACKETNDSYYVSTYFGYYFSAAWLGVCLPKHVTIELLLSQRKVIANLLQRSTGEKLTESDVDFADVKATNEKNAKASLGYYLTWSALGLLVLLAVIGSSLDYGGVLQPEAVKLSTTLKIFKCFSFTGNLKSLLNTKNKTDENLDILNGIRVIAMLWIIYDHVYDFGSEGPIKNLRDYEKEIKLSYAMTLVINGTVSVDIFFLFSGFLATLSFMKVFQNKKNRSVKTVLLSYLFRYIRLTPLLLVCILYRLYIERGLKDYPFHVKLQYDGDRCDKTWYYPLLYISNLMSSFADMCVDWTWYLMVDMQMFIFCPWIALSFAVSYNIGFIVLGSFTLFTLTSQVFSIYYFEMNYYTKTYSDLFYIQAPNRLLPYLMGIFFCVLYKEHRKTEGFYAPLKKIRDFFYNKPWIKYVLYIVCLPIMYEMVFIRNYFDNLGEEPSNIVYCLHEIFNRTIFIFCLMLIMYPTLLGQGEFLKRFLGHPIFCPFARLTYGAYVFHPFYYINNYWFALHGYYFTQFMYITNSIGTAAVSYFLSFVMTLLVESPANLLVRTFLEGARSDSPPKKQALIEEESLTKLTEKKDY
jgi:peptidoglycan/LPS O-acetylase OafA/YrhL